MTPRQLTSALIRPMAWALSIAFLSYSSAAMAYVGPGAGLGVVGAILGSLLGILALIVGAIWYPLKKLLAKFRRRT